MPHQKLVTITGIMTFHDTPVEPPQPPLGIWGPSDPRPTQPIYGFDRWTGQFPGGRPPEPPPLGIWGPNDPRPTLPIAGWNPGTGQFPERPQPTPPQGGMPGNLPASDPSGSGWVYAFVPGYGWMWAKVPQRPESPSNELPPEVAPKPVDATNPNP